MFFKCNRLCILIDITFLTVVILQLLGNLKNRFLDKNYRLGA